MILSQRFREYSSLKSSAACLDFISLFDTRWPKPNPSALPAKCLLGVRPPGNYHYLSFGPDFAHPDEEWSLPEGQRLTFQDLYEHTAGCLVSLIPSVVATEMYQWIFDDTVNEHFKNMLGAEYADLVDDGVIQGEFLLILEACYAGLDNYFINMLKRTYMCGCLPIGWHGDYPKDYGLYVEAPGGYRLS